MTPGQLAAFALIHAKRLLDEDWGQCDEKEDYPCAGAHCHVKTHRAIYLIKEAQDELDKLNKK